MVSDYETTRDKLAHLIGLRVLEDTSIESAEVGRRGGMNWIGPPQTGFSLELGEPAGHRGPVHSFLRRFGPGLHSIGLQVTDLDATVTHLADHQVRIAARSNEFQFVFCDPRDTEGLLLQFATVEMPFDPKFGAPVPLCATTPLLDITRLARIEAQVAEVESAARRLGAIIGASAEGDKVRIPGLDLHLSSSADQAQFTALGLEVPNLDEAVRTLDASGIPYSRDADEVRIQTDCTGDVALALLRSAVD